jgi:tetratricopeptide (TPR) repeat protein
MMKSIPKSNGPKKKNIASGSIGPKLSIVILCLVGILIYSNTFNSTFHLDDVSSIVNNKAIRDIGNIRALWASTPTRIFSCWTFALNYHYNGLDVAGYHIVNIAIHILSALSLWWLIRLLFSTPVLRITPAAREKEVLSLIGALIFITHPVQIEAVTYIVQRITSLAALLFLFSLGSYIRARLEKQSTKKRIAFFLLSLLSGFLAILSKENAYILPFAIVLSELFFMQEKLKIVIFVVFLSVCVWIIIPLLFYLTGRLPTTETADISRSEYLLTQFTVIPVYMRLLILPIHQNLDYDVSVVKTLLDPSTLFGLGLILTVFAAGIVLYSRHRLLSFGIFLFFLTLMIESSIIPIRDLMFEHRLYLPMAGFCFLCIGLIEIASKYISRTVLRFTVGFVILIFAVSTYARNEVWKNEITLWTDCVDKSPAKPRVYLQRGLAYHQQGMLDEAMHDYETVLRLKPDDWAAWSNIAAILGARGQYDKAIATYTRAIEVSKGMGVEVYLNRANLYSKRGLFAEAIQDLDTFIRDRPDVAEAYYNRGCIRRQLRNPNGAMTDFTRAIALDSSQGDYFFNRGFLYQQAGLNDEALSDYGRTIQRKSYGLEYNMSLGFILARRGAYKEAIKEYTLALQYNPNSTQILNERGLAFYQNGEYGKALEDLNKAIQLDSNSPQFYQNRSLIYKAMGEKIKADEDFRRTWMLMVNRSKRR